MVLLNKKGGQDFYREFVAKGIQFSNRNGITDSYNLCNYKILSSPDWAPSEI